MTIKKFINNPILLPLLAGLYPSVFMASNNWFMIQKSELMLLLFVTPIVSLIIGILFCFVLKFIMSLISKATKLKISDDFKNKLIRSGISVYSIVIVIFLFQSINESLVYSRFALILTFFVLIFIIILISYKIGTGSIFIFFSILTFLAASNGMISYFKSINKNESINWYEKNREINEKIKFTVKPNVYLIVLEAYQDTKTIKLTQNYDNKKAEKEFLKRGFIIYHNDFSNYRNTKLSLSSLFSMQHHYNSISAGKEDAIGAREIIGNKVYNSVVSVFKKNDYSVQYISHSDYCYLVGDAIDFAYPNRTIFKAYEIFDNKNLDFLLSKIIKSYKGTAADKDRMNVSTDKAYKKLIERIEIAAKGEKPYFTFFKSSLPGHYGERWQKIKKDKLNYIKELKKATRQSISIIDIVQQKDPNSIVIVLGDHGAWKYRGIWTGKSKNIHKNFKRNKITANQVARDLFGVFLSIKWQNENTPDYNIKSHVNLFRYVFSYLSKNRYPLESKLKDESIFYYKKNYISVKDGKPLDHWKTLKR